MAWWQDTYKYARLVMSLVAKTDRHGKDIEALQAEVKGLTAAIQQMAFDRQRDRDNAEHAKQVTQLQHELLVSRLETKLLSYERGLPPPAGADLRDEQP